MKPIAPKAGKGSSLRYRRGKYRLPRTRSSRPGNWPSCVCAQHDNALVACSVEGSSPESAWCAPNSRSLGLNIRDGRNRPRNALSTVPDPCCGRAALLPWLYRVSNRLGGRPSSRSNDEYTFVDRIPTAAGSRSGSPCPINGQSRGAVSSGANKAQDGPPAIDKSI